MCQHVCQWLFGPKLIHSNHGANTNNCVDSNDGANSIARVGSKAESAPILALCAIVKLRFWFYKKLES